MMSRCLQNVPLLECLHTMLAMIAGECSSLKYLFFAVQFKPKLRPCLPSNNSHLPFATAKRYFIYIILVYCISLALLAPYKRVCDGRDKPLLRRRANARSVSYTPYSTGEKHIIPTFVDQTRIQLTRRREHRKNSFFQN